MLEWLLKIFRTSFFHNIFLRLFLSYKIWRKKTSTSLHSIAFFRLFEAGILLVPWLDFGWCQNIICTASATSKFFIQTLFQLYISLNTVKLTVVPTHNTIFTRNKSIDTDVDTFCIVNPAFSPCFFFLFSGLVSEKSLYFLSFQFDSFIRKCSNMPSWQNWGLLYNLA